MTKGKLVFVEGRLQTRQFEDREGTTKTVTEVVVASLRVLGGAKSAGGSSQDTVTDGREDGESEAAPF